MREVLDGEMGFWTEVDKADFRLVGVLLVRTRYGGWTSVPWSGNDVLCLEELSLI